MAKTGILYRKNTVFIMIDFQEAFRLVVPDFEKAAKNANILAKGAQILGVPLLATEQYPKGLGKTAREIGIQPGVEMIEKKSFGCFGCKEFERKLQALGAKSIVLFGLEAHVCVLETALEALEKGLEVHVAADAIASRKEENKRIAIERMRQSGVFIDSTETVLFQILKEAGSEEFKKISALVK